jgi:hypothetical protein
MGRHFDLDLTVAGATRDRLLDEARQGRGEDDYSSIARRFLPFVNTPDLEERQPDLFSPKPAAVPHENPEFIEQQLAELEKTQIPAPTFEQEEIPEDRVSDLKAAETTLARPESEAEISPDLEQKPVEMETPRQVEPEPEEEKPVKAAVESNGDSESVEEKPGFFSRLLRRTDY